MSRTPTLDKFGLHPFGGRCTCFTHPHSKCEICEQVKLSQERWKNLTEEDRKKAHAEMEILYPSEPDSLRGGR